MPLKVDHLKRVHIWGFSRICGIILGGPYNKDESILGSAYLGKLPYHSLHILVGSREGSAILIVRQAPPHLSLESCQIMCDVLPGSLMPSVAMSGWSFADCGLKLSGSHLCE